MSVDVKKLSSMSQDMHLLYVEDDALTRETTLKLLQNFFKNIMVAVDGKEALEVFAHASFDLILSDIKMPKMNGLEFIEAVREINQNIPVLMMSAHTENDYLLTAVNLNVDGYLLKPLDYKLFLQSLFRVVEKVKFYKISKNYQKNLELEVKKRNEEITHKLSFDALTGLLSRDSFFSDIENLYTQVILLIDIDKFKVVNEVYGSDIGSRVLEKFAHYLRLAMKDDSSCKLYRISADEFAIVDETDYIDTEKYEELIEKLFKELNNIKIRLDENIITLDITIGLSTVEINGYESAKIALDYAKKHKRPFVMYSSAIDPRQKSSLTLKCRDDILCAIENDRVVPVYQAIVDENKKIVKYETLMRLQEKETLDLISPYHFLDVAIKTRLYEYLSSTIIFTALKKINKSDHTLSMNFTYSDIRNKIFTKKIEGFLKEHEEIGSRVIFEITESESIENYDDVKKFIKRFRAYGVQIAIDDFGSGFSNFEYILEIEPEYLKIDGSLIKDIDTDTKAHTLVEAIVQFSHKLGIKVIAEYVHSEIIFDMLKKLEVDEYQGFYFHEPVEEI